MRLLCVGSNETVASAVSRSTDQAHRIEPNRSNASSQFWTKGVCKYRVGLHGPEKYPDRTPTHTPQQRCSRQASIETAMTTQIHLAYPEGLLRPKTPARDAGSPSSNPKSKGTDEQRPDRPERVRTTRGVPPRRLLLLALSVVSRARPRLLLALALNSLRAGIPPQPHPSISTENLKYTHPTHAQDRPTMPPALQDAAAAMGPPPTPAEAEAEAAAGARGKCGRGAAAAGAGAGAAGQPTAQGTADRPTATQRVGNVPGTSDGARRGPRGGAVGRAFINPSRRRSGMGVGSSRPGRVRRRGPEPQRAGPCASHDPRRLTPISPTTHPPIR